MQAISSSPATKRRELARDLAALANYVMRSANAGALNAIAELDLSMTQFKALCTMEADGDGQARSVKALAEALGVSLAAVSRAVDGLFERGLVSREEDPADRRMKRVRPTDAGRAVPRALSDARMAALRELVSSLDDEQADALQHALALILERHEEIAAYRPTEKGARR